jgi:hypothetical protein
MEVNNRYMAHSTSDENYVYLSGNTLNCLSVADNPPLDVSGDLDIQVKVAADDWTPSTAQSLATKWGYTTNQRSYLFQLFTDGTLRFQWSANGTTSTTINSTVAPTVTDGADLWVRVTLDVDNGASGNDVKFYTSSNGTTWTQLGTTVTTAGVASLFNSTSQLTIGATRDTGPDNNFKGKFYRAIIKNGIDGTTVLDANAAVITLPSQTTFTDSSSNAYTVTINKSGVGTFVSTGNYMYLPGVASNYASAPDAAALDITGDIDLRCKVALDDWTPAANTTLIAKYTTTGNQRSYRMYIGTSGQIVLQVSTDGTTPITLTNNATTGVSDGSTKWVRATRVASTGLCQFFTSDNGTTWTQLSTDVSGTSGNLFSGTAIMEVGSQTVGASEPARGKFFRAQVLNGIGGTVAFDANFEGSITSLNQASFTESSTNAATVTINRSGSTFRSAGVIDAGYLYPGATNTFANSTIDYLNFGATDSFTVMAFTRNWSSSAATNGLVAKGTTNTTNGYTLYRYYAGSSSSFQVADGTVNPTAETPAQTAGVATLATGIRNVSIDKLTAYVNATAGTPVTDTTTATLSTTTTVTIGKVSTGGYLDGELYAAAVFRQALTAAQVRQITNYFANREVYL